MTAADGAATSESPRYRTVPTVVVDDDPRTVNYGRYVDVAALLAGDLPPAPRPVYGRRDDSHALFYARQVNMLFGDPESGKTWVALAATAELLRSRNASGRVLVVDLDHNGAAATMSRLLALGVDKDALSDRSRFLYVEPEDALHVAGVVADMEVWAPDIAVVDSLGELIPLYGSNSNSADDFTTVHARVLKPLARSAAVLLIDHLAKGDASRAFGPGGTGAKRRAIGGTSIRVRVKEAFTPGKPGSAYLTVNKDRHGGLREHCPTGDREPLAGVFHLDVFAGGVLEARIAAPKAGDSAPPDFGIATGTDPARLAADVSALDALDPPPKSQRDVAARMGWGGGRAADALRAWRSRDDE